MPYRVAHRLPARGIRPHVHHPAVPARRRPRSRGLRISRHSASRGPEHPAHCRTRRPAPVLPRRLPLQHGASHAGDGLLPERLPVQSPPAPVRSPAGVHRSTLSPAGHDPGDHAARRRRPLSPPSARSRAGARRASSGTAARTPLLTRKRISTIHPNRRAHSCLNFQRAPNGTARRHLR